MFQNDIAGHRKISSLFYLNVIRKGCRTEIEFPKDLLFLSSCVYKSELEN